MAGANDELTVTRRPHYGPDGTLVGWRLRFRNHTTGDPVETVDVSLTAPERRDRARAAKRAAEAEDTWRDRKGVNRRRGRPPRPRPNGGPGRRPGGARGGR